MISYREAKGWRTTLKLGTWSPNSEMKRGTMSGPISLVKVFSATTKRAREELGERVTGWIRDRPDTRVVKTMVRLSSDHSFHCLSIVLLCSNDMAGRS
jgi:hypothetical protein